MRTIFIIWLSIISMSFGLIWLKMDETQRGKIKAALGDIVTPTGDSAEEAEALDEEVKTVLLPSEGSGARASRITRPSYHGVTRSAACKPAPSRERIASEQVYRWQDEDGVTHFSNLQPTFPAGASVSRITVERKDYFSANLNREQSRLSADTFRRIQSGVTLIYRMLTDVIGVEESRHIELNMRFIDSKEAFHQHRLRVAPESSPNATGFYSTGTNESVIYSGMGDRITERIALHEATHAIVAAMFGTTTPTWLNEGLASYMEELEIQGQQARRVGHDRLRLEIIRQAAAPDLARLLSSSHAQWYSAASIENNYAFSWSVVRFMMSDRRTIGILGGMVNALAMGQCLELDARAHIDSAYPGGFVAYERNWRAWMRHGREGVQVF